MKRIYHSMQRVDLKTRITQKYFINIEQHLNAPGGTLAEYLELLLCCVKLKPH